MTALKASGDPSHAEGGVRKHAVTIGTFDGLHRGHRQLLATMMREARARDLGSAAVTFDRHPLATLRPELAPLLLADLGQKRELLEATGLDEVVVVPFDDERAHQPAEAFVEEILVDRLHAELVVVGSDFRFGWQRRGDVALLASLGAREGFEVIGLELVRDPTSAEPLSSTAIRALVADGAVEAAGRRLGRPFELRGTLIEGELHAARECIVPAAGSFEVSVVELGTSSSTTDGAPRSWEATATVIGAKGQDPSRRPGVFVAEKSHEERSAGRSARGERRYVGVRFLAATCVEEPNGALQGP
jgi:riboflavin kinase/FMN adenylyltransferase